MSMCRESLLLCCWKRVFAMTSAFSWQNAVNLCPASFCTPRPYSPVTPVISWYSTFAFQSPMRKRTSFLVLAPVLVGHHRTIQHQLFWHWWLGHKFGLLWHWMVCLGNEERSFCHFWDCNQTLHFWLFVDYEGYWISSKRFLPTVVDIMVIWVMFTHSNPF